MRTSIRLTLIAAGAVAALTGCADTTPATSAEPVDQLVTTDPTPEPTGRGGVTPLPAEPVATTAPTVAPQVDVVVPRTRPTAAAPVAPVAPAVEPVQEQLPEEIIGRQITVDGMTCVIVNAAGEYDCPVQEQLPEEVIGSYRCGDTNLVVTRLAPDGSYICGDPSLVGLPDTHDTDPESGPQRPEGCGFADPSVPGGWVATDC